MLTVRLAGAHAAVGAALVKLGGEVLADDAAAHFWRELRDHRLEFFAGEEPLWRLSLPSTAPPTDLPARTLIEWGGSQRWLRGGADAAGVRAVTARFGGHATLFRGGDKSAGVFQPLPPALAALNRRVRRALDPKGIFDTGRL
jgi:glycolate oxidase FAD binding subunit